MMFLKLHRVSRAARREAALGVNSRDDHVVADLGPRPAFDPVGNQRHAQINAANLDRAEAEELRADLRQAEDELLRHPSSQGLGAGLLFCFGVEVLGAIQIMRGLGVDGPERTLLAAMLAAFVIFLTYMTARAGASSRSEGQGHAS